MHFCVAEYMSAIMLTRTAFSLVSLWLMQIASVQKELALVYDEESDKDFV